MIISLYLKNDMPQNAILKFKEDGVGEFISGPSMAFEAVLILVSNVRPYAMNEVIIDKTVYTFKRFKVG